MKETKNLLSQTATRTTEPAMPKESKEIPTAIDRVERSVCELEKIVAMLDEKLVTIKADVPRPIYGATKAENRCTLADVLEGFAFRIKKIVLGLEDTIEDIQL